MEHRAEILRTYLSEQIALEEQLCRIIEDQIAEIDDSDFEDAKDLLTNARQVLERHFTPLNELLDKIEQEALSAQKVSAATNGAGAVPLDLRKNDKKVSRILRDDYSALNLITISNTLLHTTALALGCLDIAALALQHLENLAPLVVRLGKLMPAIITRELRHETPSVDPSVAVTALRNAQLAWQRAS